MRRQRARADVGSHAQEINACSEEAITRQHIIATIKTYSASECTSRQSIVSRKTSFPENYTS